MPTHVKTVTKDRSVFVALALGFFIGANPWLQLQNSQEDNSSDPLWLLSVYSLILVYWLKKRLFLHLYWIFDHDVNNTDYTDCDTM